MATKKPHRKETRYVTTIVVHVGSAVGIIDMMRYDSCFPATEEDSVKLNFILDRAQCDEHTRLVRMTRVSKNDGLPTYGRWKSFRCTVLEVLAPDERLPSDQEMSNMLAEHRALQHRLGENEEQS